MVQPFITAEQRSQLLAKAKRMPPATLATRCPWCGCSPRDAHATWLLAALDPADGDTAYGLCDVGICMPDLGLVKLSDLECIVGPRDQPILRDRYFRPTRSLGEYARLAQSNVSGRRLAASVR